MRTYVVYKATNLINGMSYIGKTNQFKERVWQHLRKYEKEKCLFHDALDEYGDDNFSFEILAEVTNDDEAVELEKHFIEKYDTLKPFGYNMNKGGTGGHNARPVVCLDVNGNYIKRYNSAAEAEQIDGYNNTCVLVSCKNENRRCNGHIFMFEDEYIKNGARKYIAKRKENRIIQCDLEGNQISSFRNINEASSMTGTRRTSISGNLSGKYKTANGFIFVREKDFPIKDIEKHIKVKKGRKIAQVNPETDEIVEVFDRISDAGSKLNVNYKSIHKVVDLENRTAYGYKWISQ